MTLTELWDNYKHIIFVYAIKLAQKHKTDKHEYLGTILLYINDCQKSYDESKGSFQKYFISCIHRDLLLKAHKEDSDRRNLWVRNYKAKYERSQAIKHKRWKKPGKLRVNAESRVTQLKFFNTGIKHDFGEIDINDFIRRVFNSLNTETEIEIFNLHFICNYSFRDLSVLYDITRQAAHNYVSRRCKKLAKELKI